jgi:hypothetical protein
MNHPIEDRDITDIVDLKERVQLLENLSMVLVYRLGGRVIITKDELNEAAGDIEARFSATADTIELIHTKKGNHAN